MHSSHKSVLWKHPQTSSHSLLGLTPGKHPDMIQKFVSCFARSAGRDNGQLIGLASYLLSAVGVPSREGPESVAEEWRWRIMSLTILPGELKALLVIQLSGHMSCMT